MWNGGQRACAQGRRGPIRSSFEYSCRQRTVVARRFMRSNCPAQRQKCTRRQEELSLWDQGKLDCSSCQVEAVVLCKVAVAVSVVF